MPQSLARVHIHLIFSTKNREPLLHDTIRDPLHRYLAVVLRNYGCPADLINSIEDHIHILFNLGRTATGSLSGTYLPPSAPIDQALPAASAHAALDSGAGSVRVSLEPRSAIYFTVPV